MKENCYSLWLGQSSVETDEMTFKVFQTSRRRERYWKERDKAHRRSWNTDVESVRDARVIDPLNIVMWKEEKEILYAAIERLNSDEKELITALFFNEMTVASYARTVGRARSTISERRDRTLGKLKDYLLKAGET